MGTKIKNETGELESVVRGEKESLTPVNMEVCAVHERSESVLSRISDVSASVKRRRASENESVAAIELMCMKAIELRLRKFLFNESSKVSKSASEYILNCVGKYEEQLMRMLAKNERLQGKLDECLSRVSRDVAQSVCEVADASCASVAGKEPVRNVISANVECKSDSVRKEKERNYAVVVKSNNESTKLSSEQVKESDA